MAQNKTAPTDASVEDFIDAIGDERRRDDARAIDAMFRSVTRRPAVLWGPSIVGYGAYTYDYASGREGSAPVVAWAPRSTRLTLYVSGGFDGFDDLLDQLGPHTRSGSCLHIKRLADVDRTVLRRLVTASVKHVRATRPTT